MKFRFTSPSAIEFIVKVIFVTILTVIEILLLGLIIGPPVGWDVYLLAMINWTTASVKIN